MSDILTVTISGPPGDVDRILRRLGGGELDQPPAENHTEVRPEPYQNHTAPAPTSPPAEKPTKRKKAKQPEGEGLTPERQAVLDLLDGHSQSSRDLAAKLGLKAQGVSATLRLLDRLGLAREVHDTSGRRCYVRAGEPEPVAEPEQPAPPVDLPARAPYLQIRDLSGHARCIAEALALAAKPLARNVLAEQLCLADDEVRDTLRLLIRQGYVTRLDGNVVRYALTDAVVRDEAARAAGKG